VYPQPTELHYPPPGSKLCQHEHGHSFHLLYCFESLNQCRTNGGGKFCEATLITTCFGEKIRSRSPTNPKWTMATVLVHTTAGARIAVSLIGTQVLHVYRLRRVGVCSTLCQLTTVAPIQCRFYSQIFEHIYCSDLASFSGSSSMSTRWQFLILRESVIVSQLPVNRRFKSRSVRLWLRGKQLCNPDCQRSQGSDCEQYSELFLYNRKRRSDRLG